MSADAIRLLGADLELGAAHAGLVCPFCGGGRSREGSFRVQRVPDGLRYRCFRAKCGRAGLAPDAAGAGLAHAVRRQRVRQGRPEPDREYLGSPVALPPEHVEFYARQFCIGPGLLLHAGVLYDEQERRHVWPIFDPYQRVRGHNLRAASDSWVDPPIPVRVPKTLTFWPNDQPRCAWYARGARRADTLLVVEDQISALRAFEFCDALALLGTNLHADAANEIARQGYAQILLALDQDATGQAYKLARKYGGMLPLRVLPLGRDIKDLDPAEVRSLLRRGGITSAMEGEREGTGDNRRLHG